MPASEIGIKDVLIKIHKTAIGFPTVPKGLARIRVMISAMLSREDLDYGLEKFAQVGRELGVI